MTMECYLLTMKPKYDEEDFLVAVLKGETVDYLKTINIEAMTTNERIDASKVLLGKRDAGAILMVLRLRGDK